MSNGNKEIEALKVVKEVADKLEDEIKVAKEMEEAVEEVKEIEDLSGVDVGLGGEDETNLIAQERYQIAISYQRLKIRGDTVRASVAANKGVGNTEAVDRFLKELKTLDEQIMHCLRGIKTIDKQHPRVKVRMQEIAEITRRRPEACPQCGMRLK